MPLCAPDRYGADIECPDSKGIKTSFALLCMSAPDLILNALIQKGLRRATVPEATYSYLILNALIQKGLRLAPLLRCEHQSKLILNALIQKGLRQKDQQISTKGI